jgi:hypothetical protein
VLVEGLPCQGPFRLRLREYRRTRASGVFINRYIDSGTDSPVRWWLLSEREREREIYRERGRVCACCLCVWEGERREREAEGAAGARAAALPWL